MAWFDTRLGTAELEQEYRAWAWPGALRRARIAIATASVVFLLFVYPDFLFFGWQWPFAGLLALRLSVVALGVAVLYLLAGPPRPARFDRLMFAWTAWVGLLVAVVLPASRPNAWILHGFITCTAIPAIYALIPTTFFASAVTGIGMGGGYLAFVVSTNAALTYMQGVVLGVALVAANLIGLVMSRWLHQSNRAAFQQERSVRRAEDNLNTLVEALPFPVALVRVADRRLVRLNDAARALFSGASAPRGAEQAIERLLLRLPELAASDGSTREVSLDGCAEGASWLLVSARSIVHHESPCVILSFVDITTRKAAEEALADAKRTADEASRAKSAFLATMSHEIRTPLHGILGAAQLLERSAPSEEARGPIDTIRACAAGVLELVDGVLDLSRAEAGTITPVRTVFEPHALVGAVVESFAARAAGRVVTRVDEAVPVRLAGDQARVRRVLSNLVDNALKYGDASPVTVEVALRADAESMRVRYAVENGGAPIPTAARAAIFEPFVQLASASDGARHGVGLGLAICRREVEALGGALSLEDGPGGRTVFAFTLPLEEPRAGELPTVAVVAQTPPARALSLLVAEDDAVSARLAHALLSDAGHRVTLAANGLEAVAAAGREAFDAVLMDMRMPDCDGVEATRQIRALPDPARARVPIIATTANAMVEDRQRYLAAGVSAVMAKPLDFRALEALLGEVVSGLGRAPGEQPDPPCPTAEADERTPRPWIDERVLVQYRRALGVALVGELQALCVRTGGPLVEAIRAAAARHESETVARHAHRLASAAQSAAFARLGDSAAALETLARAGADAASLQGGMARLASDWQGTLRAHADDQRSASTATPSR